MWRIATNILREINTLLQAIVDGGGLGGSNGSVVVVNDDDIISVTDTHNNAIFEFSEQFIESFIDCILAIEKTFISFEFFSCGVFLDLNVFPILS